MTEYLDKYGRELVYVRGPHLHPTREQRRKAGIKSTLAHMLALRGLAEAVAETKEPDAE